MGSGSGQFQGINRPAKSLSVEDSVRRIQWPLEWAMALMLPLAASRSLPNGFDSRWLGAKRPQRSRAGCGSIVLLLYGNHDVLPYIIARTHATPKRMYSTYECHVLVHREVMCLLSHCLCRRTGRPDMVEQYWYCMSQPSRYVIGRKYYPNCTWTISSPVQTP